MKKLEIKILIDDIVTNLLIILKICKHRGYKKKIYYTSGFVKIHIKKNKKLTGVTLLKITKPNKYIYIYIYREREREKWHTLSNRRCSTTKFPAPTVLSCRSLVPSAPFLTKGLRRRLTRASPSCLIWGTKANAWKLTLQRSCWMSIGKLSKAKRWENGAIAAIP